MSAPSEIRLKRAEQAIEIAWPDGARYRLPAEYLRVESPSAEVQGHGPGQKVIIAGRRHVGILRVEAVGNRVSDELFIGGLIALALSFGAMLLYIWFRFEWQFAIAGVATLMLDTTKVVGVMVVTGIEFNLTTVAAILTIIGFNANDKVVVFDRMRENLRKYKTMALDQLVDLSINETMNRTLGTSMTLLLSAVPLALFGGDTLSGFAWVMIAGIVISAGSSVFIAAPIVLFTGRRRLRKPEPAVGAAPAKS